MEDKNRNKECFDVSLRRRNLEIELFWKRALFFWGFIAAAFWGFIVIKERCPDYAVLLASFGFICSVCWTLTNRGSKRWQENWEQRSEQYGKDFVGDLLETSTPIHKEKGWWLRAREFSPSKLAISLSDYTVVLWLIILLNELGITPLKEYLRTKWLFGIITLIWVLLTLWCARSSKRPPKKIQGT